jgi:hypothetical protein
MDRDSFESFRDTTRRTYGAWAVPDYSRKEDQKKIKGKGRGGKGGNTGGRSNLQQSGSLSGMQQTQKAAEPNRDAQPASGVTAALGSAFAISADQHKAAAAPPMAQPPPACGQPQPPQRELRDRHEPEANLCSRFLTEVPPDGDCGYTVAYLQSHPDQIPHYKKMLKKEGLAAVEEAYKARVTQFRHELLDKIQHFVKKVKQTDPSEFGDLQKLVRESLSSRAQDSWPKLDSSKLAKDPDYMWEQFFKFHQKPRRWIDGSILALYSRAYKVKVEVYAAHPDSQGKLHKNAGLSPEICGDTDDQFFLDKEHYSFLDRRAAMEAGMIPTPMKDIVPESPSTSLHDLLAQTVTDSASHTESGEDGAQRRTESDSGNRENDPKDGGKPVSLDPSSLEETPASSATVASSQPGSLPITSGFPTVASPRSLRWSQKDVPDWHVLNTFIEVAEPCGLPFTVRKAKSLPPMRCREPDLVACNLNNPGSNPQEYGCRDQGNCHDQDDCGFFNVASGWSGSSDAGMVTNPPQQGHASIQYSGETVQNPNEYHPENEASREAPAASKAAAFEILSDASRNNEADTWTLSHGSKASSLKVQEEVKLAAGTKNWDAASMLIFPLAMFVVQACKDINANHVMSTLLEVLPTNLVSHVIKGMQGYVSDIAKDRYGCRCIIRLVKYHGWSGDAIVQSVIDELLQHVAGLACSQYGQFVVSEWLSNDSKDADAVVKELQRNMQNKELQRNMQNLIHDNNFFRAMKILPQGPRRTQIVETLSSMPQVFFNTSESNRLLRVLTRVQL